MTNIGLPVPCGMTITTDACREYYNNGKMLPEGLVEEVTRNLKAIEAVSYTHLKDLIYEILSVVEEIPEGCVATYGQIARLIGRDKNSRLVGKVLSMAEYYGDYPCHRVVNHAGRLVPGWLEQRLLLEAEQVAMKDDRHVDLKKCRWDY